MQRRAFSIAATSVSLLIAAPAEAQDGTSILHRVDSTLNAYSDLTAVERMTLIDADRDEKVRVLEVYQKGPERRMVKFTTPADVRDVGFLRLADDQMYLYLPTFRRVRRISSSVKNEAFMGTDLSYEDLSRTQFGADYNVVESTAGENSYLLVLEPKAGADVSYGRITMDVQRDTWVITHMQFYGKDGGSVKRAEASTIEQVNGYWIARRIEVETIKDGHQTVLEFEELQFDKGLDDDFFSQRQLKRRA